MNSRRSFLTRGFAAGAALAAVPVAAVVPAIVRAEPDVAPILNKMMLDLSRAGGGTITMAPRKYSVLSSILMRSDVTLDAAGAKLEVNVPDAPAIQINPGVKRTGLRNVSVCYLSTTTAAVYIPNAVPRIVAVDT